MRQPSTETLAVVLDGPERLSLRRLALEPMGEGDVEIDIQWSGISTGTERLLWSGRMPSFPGMGYPLVPGYESVGRVVSAGTAARNRVGDYVFVPGATCFKDARGLFGGAAERLVVPASRAIPISESLAEQGVLLALAATAMHAILGGEPPELIVGHGVLGRLLARITIARGYPPPVVWESNPSRIYGSNAYQVIDPQSDERRDYRVIYDASGDPAILDRVIARLARHGEIVLAGFYDSALSFQFPPAFMKEARMRVAAEWQPGDIAATKAAIDSGALSLDGLITHRRDVSDVESAYRTAFEDAGCLKFILDWRGCA